MNARQINAIESLLREHQVLNKEVADLQDKLSQVKEKIFEHLEKNALETLQVGEDGAVIKVTIVRPSSLKIDEEALKSRLTAPQWKSVTVQVVNKKALEDAVVRGKIGADLISECSWEANTKPYLRITG